jgi:8-oxo-dGTP pyrophosphatase MutT (NUDIX family)
MSDGRLGDSSSNFVLSSGTVSIDISESVVLALYYPQKKEFFLPKGRKNVGETLQAAAVRETMEESGYQCQLLEHNLQTQAPNLTPGPWTTEPIAIHQRVTNGIRKIIFWYLAQVNSSSLQMLNTQEEGEDFEVHWISLDMASAKMTYEEDQEVVSIALAAVAQRAILLNPLTATDWFREQYLNPSINMSTLGLLCVCLGGSVVSGQSDYSHPQDVEDDRDWDGIGIVERKEDIIRLANHRKADLCKLLRIDTEEQPSLTVSHMGLVLSPSH